jgi:uncharacterized protein (TIGR02271 family)
MLSAFFDERDDAEEAVSHLVEAGVPQSGIHLVPGSEGGQSVQAERREPTGFWESLGDFFFPNEDRYAYAEGLRRGGYLVTVSDLPAGLHDRAVDILDDEGAIDFDAREQSWRGEGWKGYQAGTMGSAAAGATTASSPGRAAGDETIIPVTREELHVGKRDRDLGKVRVRSYVVEEPVSEQVNLEEERVKVERRPVDRALKGSEAAFEDREIVAEEHIEEPVVEKTARVTEEVALRKEKTSHPENISDTVRHTEVEIEDERNRNRRKSGTNPES